MRYNLEMGHIILIKVNRIRQLILDSLKRVFKKIKVKEISENLLFVFKLNLNKIFAINLILECFFREHYNYRKVQMEMQISYLEDSGFLQIIPGVTEDVNSKGLFGKARQQIRNLQKFEELKIKKRQQSKKNKLTIDLKELITKGKVKNLRDNFIRKMKRTIINKKYTQSIKHSQQYDEMDNVFNKISFYLQSKQGFYLSPMLHCIWSLINIIQITMIIIIYSLTITFPQTSTMPQFRYARVFSVSLYIIDMILNFITQKHEMIGGTVKNFKSIIFLYLKQGFAPDFFSIIMYPFSSIVVSNFIINLILLVIAFVKLRNNVKKFQKFQYIYVGSTEKQHYYGLIKVFLLNFSIGHILSIFLNLMAQITENYHNWYDKVNIQDQVWYIKYIWGYYWGTNIMLTVGFGDLCAQNTTEATVLIFIETISCITLAYNISCVGSIMSAMSAQNQQKKKKVKYFHKMCQEYKIPQQLQQKINYFIQESYQIKKSFQFEEYEQVLQSLPKSMQSEYRTQSNQILFQVGFFKSLNKKTILNLAQSITRKIAHPQQLLKKKGQISNFCLLQKGIIGLACRSGSKSILNGVIIQKYEILENQKPKILSLDFIKRKLLKFDLKSLFYSVIYYLEEQNFMKILSNCEMDYQFLLAMRDKEQTLLGGNEIYQCKDCQNEFHTKFQCPKYHYMPLKSLIVAKYTQKSQRFKQNRSKDVERTYGSQKCLFIKKTCEEDHDRFLNQIYDEDQLRQINTHKLYYYEKQKEAKLEKSINSLNLFGEGQSAFDKHMRKIQQIIVKSTQKILNFWDVESDEAHNFKYYFKQYNSNRLTQFKLSHTKKKPKDMIFGALSYKKQATPFFIKKFGNDE